VSERIGVLGGTFDPIHIGHLILAEEARIALALDQVLFVPAAQPWRKSDRTISPAADRLVMVRLAIAGNVHFHASTLEIDRGGPTYTADTLEELHAAAPQAALWFILGADALHDLPNWKEPDRILKQARLAVARRPDPQQDSISGGEAFPQSLVDKIDPLPMPLISMSSSELRRRLREGISVRYWLDPSVADYARDHALYETAGSQPWVRGT
jgi:nicotinate-nucleotide adenylyltransferase